MKETKTKLLRRQPSTTWAQVGFRGCFIVFAALFLLTNVRAFADIPTYESEVGVHASINKDASLTFNRNSDNHPIRPCLVLTECEAVDEVNTENEFGGEGIDITALSLPAEIKFGHHVRKSLFAHLQLASDRRETISLFILHHCWKSFLS